MHAAHHICILFYLATWYFSIYNSDPFKFYYDSETTSMEESSLNTIKFLRARLLSERSVSKTARQRADELAKKVSCGIYFSKLFDRHFYVFHVKFDVTKIYNQYIRFY